MKRRYITLLTSLAGILACSIFSKGVESKKVQETEAAELPILKYDFNSSENWTNANFGSTVSMSVSSSVYHDQSKNSLYIPYNCKNYGGNVVSTSARSVTPGTTYDLSYWVRSKKASTRSTIQLVLHNSANATQNYQFKTFTLNGSSTLSEWTEVKNRFVIPEGITSVYPEFLINKGVGEVYLDDFTLTPVSSSDILSRHDSFEQDDSGNYGVFTKKNSIYETKILELDEYDYYSISLSMSQTTRATVKFVDYRGEVIDSFYKDLNIGSNELVFQAASSTYALLDLGVIPNSYVLKKIGCNNVARSNYGVEKNKDGKPFAVNQLAGAKHGFGYYISKYNCKNTQYPNFYYSGLNETSPIVFMPSKHFVFEYYIKVMNADSGFSFKNNLLMRDTPSGGNDQYGDPFTTYVDGKKIASGGNLTGIYDGKWHKVTKEVTPTSKRYIQFYWEVVDKTKGADVYVDELKITWYYSNYNLNSMNYKATELDLYEYEGYTPVKKETETTSRIENSKLYVDNEVTSPIIYLEPNHYYYMQNESITRMAKSHLDLYSTYFGGLNYMWNEDGSIDFEEFDKSINDLLHNGPNVRIMVNFGMFAPDWWGEQNPDEISLMFTSSSTTTHGHNNFSPDANNGVSFASQKFISDASDVLTRIYAHMKQQDYFNSIFAFKISAGRTYEWMNYGMGTDYPNELGDYCPASLSAWKVYLRNKYGTIDALNSAWGLSSKQKFSSFDAVTAPTYDERRTSDNGTFFENQKMVDFNMFVSDCASEMLLSFAKLMKGLCNNNKIVGAYNGYVWLNGGYAMVGTCHSAFDKVITSPYIDFIASPLNYGERLLGQTSAFMTLNDTVRANGKLYFLENDNRTSMAFKNNLGNDDSDSLNTALGVAFNMDETIKYQKSDFANEFINGAAMWYYDMSGNWFDNDQYYQMLDLEKSEMDYANQKDVNYVNDIAVFVDETTNAYVVQKAEACIDQLLNAAYPTLRKELSRVGAGYDVYSMSSLKQGIVPNHKINIFTGVINVDDSEKTAIESLKKNNNILIFCGPTGYGNNNDWGTKYDAGAVASVIKGTSEIVGMPIIPIDKKYGMSVITNSDCGFGQVEYGNVGQATDFATKISDKSIHKITNLGYLSTNSKYVGLGMKNMGSWTSVYSSAWYVPAELVRYFLNQAGGHLYTDEPADTIYSNSNYVGITATSSGNKTIHLPQNSSVYDVFAGRYLSLNAKDISFYLDNFDTKVLRIEAPKANVSVDNGNGEVSGYYDIGSTITLSAVDKQYYKFVGFYNGDTLVTSSKTYTYTVTENANIVAKYAPIEYKITFKDGGNVVKEYTYTIEDYDSVVAPTLSPREHYTYSWEAYTLFSSENIVVNSVWKEIAKHTVTFKNGTTTVKTIQVYDGEIIPSSEIPTVSKDHASFIGWYCNGSLFDFTKPVKSDLTLTAKFNDTAVHKVTFKDGSSVVSEIEVFDGDIISSNQIPTLTKDHATLLGWNLNGSRFDFTTPITSDITLVAAWQNDELHTITFKNEGNVIKTIQVYDGETISSSQIPTLTKDHATFSGWSYNGVIFDFTTPITSDMTLVAVWENDALHTITFKSDGNVLKTIQVYDGETIPQNAIPSVSKEHYSLTGWYYNGSLFDFSQAVTKDMILVASWSENAKHTVTFKNGDETISTIQVYDGETIPQNAIPEVTKEDATFDGWFIGDNNFDFTTPINSNLILEAKFTDIEVNYATVSIEINGEIKETIQVRVGGEFDVSTLEVPSLEGYTFKGWSFNNQIITGKMMVTGNITIKAQFEKIGTRKGCFGSVVSASSVVGLVSLIGLVAVIGKKKKYN